MNNKRNQSEALGVCWYDTPEGWLQAASVADRIGWHADAGWMRSEAADLQKRQAVEFWTRWIVATMTAIVFLLVWKG